MSEYKFDRNYLKLLIDNKDKLIEVPITDVKLILTYCEILLYRQEENEQLKEELQQFQYDFEKQEAEVFNELEQAINETDLSDKTKEYLIDLMNKDVNIVFGIVEDKIQELKEKYK